MGNDPIFGIMLLLIAVIAAVAIVSRMYERQGEDRRDAFWSTIAEPLIYIQMDIDDTGVVADAAHARRMIREHGNPYLTHADIYTFIWRADDQDPGLDFSTWVELKFQQALKIRADFRKTKTIHARAAANKILGGQEFDDLNDE